MGQQGKDKARYYAGLIVRLSLEAAASGMAATLLAQRLSTEGHPNYNSTDISHIKSWLLPLSPIAHQTDSFLSPKSSNHSLPNQPAQNPGPDDWDEGLA